MKGIKPLQPSLREKKRYVAFEMICKKSMTFNQISKAILDSALKYSGVKDLAEMGLIVLKERFKKNKGIIRVSTKTVKCLKAALTLIKEIDKIPVVFRTLTVSGVLQKANKIISKEGNSCNQCHIN